MTTTTKQTYELTIKHTIDDELLNSIIITAIEGGINYWANITDTGDSFNWQIEGTEETKDDFWPLILNPQGVLRGLEKLCKEQYCNQRIYDYIMHAIADNDGSHIDADAADVIVQVALFNKLVYG